MASKSYVLQEDLSCPICCDIFNDPVLLTCSHSYCKACLQECWRWKEDKECPVCRRRSSRNEPPCNLILKNLCEAFQQTRKVNASAASDCLCTLHSEKLKLYCQEDQQPVCVVCQASKKHKEHNFSPLDEAAQDHKDELQTVLKPLQEKLQVFNKVKQTCHQIAKQIRIQSQQTELQIKEEFKNLNHFLQEEEEAKLTALREEEEQKLDAMNEKIETLSREMSTISEKIRAINKELNTEDILFLQNYKSTVKRAQCTLTDPQLVPNALIDVAKHLGNLSFRVWEKMERVYTPVILDPNTAQQCLVLSEDLTRVTNYKVRQPLPDNPERFDYCPWVLGSEGFISGTHSWDIEVGDNEEWSLGVVTESLQRKGCVEGGYWQMGFSEGIYTGYSSVPRLCAHIAVRENPRKVRVQLDGDRGELSFSDADTNISLHKFKYNSGERLYPYIANDMVSSDFPLRVLPERR
ncbi:E3 ubiquitin-protein ligase TRIM35-like [Aplochiton taeniatus]